MWVLYSTSTHISEFNIGGHNTLKNKVKVVIYILSIFIIVKIVLKYEVEKWTWKIC